MFDMVKPTRCALFPNYIDTHKGYLYKKIQNINFFKNPIRAMFKC